MKAEQLTEDDIRKLHHAATEQNIRDSKCLYLRVGPGDSSKRVRQASWIVRTTRKGKSSKTTIGHYPALKPAAARKERDRLLGINNSLSVTVNEAICDFRALVLDKMKSGWQLETYLKHLDDSIGHRKLAAVTRADLVTLIKRYAQERGQRTAARYLGTAKGIMDLAVEHGTLDQSPLTGVTARITGYSHVPRNRVLSDDEIRQVWSWDHRHANLIRFLLLTGLRISEAQRGYRDGSRWIVPASVAKNGRRHWCHLPALAKKQLLHPFDTSPTAVQAWLKRRLTSLQIEPRWTAHDCRRTFVTRLSELGVDPVVVERCVNHKLPKIMDTYNLAEYQQQRIRAAKMLSLHIQRLM